MSNQTRLELARLRQMIARRKMWHLYPLLSVLVSCTTLNLDSGQFHASRTAWFYDTETDLTLNVPSCDGKAPTTLSAAGLKSTVNTKSLESLINAAVKP